MSTTYTLTLESVAGETDEYAGYLVTLGLDERAARDTVDALPHSWSGLSHDDCRLVQTALEAWGGRVSTARAGAAQARRLVVELFPNLAGFQGAPSPALPATPQKTRFVSFGRRPSAATDTFEEPEDTFDHAAGHVQEPPEPITVWQGAAPPGTFRWLSVIAISGLAYAAVAVYGCAATWSDEHDFNTQTESFAAALGEIDAETGRVTEQDVGDVVYELARAAGVHADTSRIEIFSYFIDSERKRQGTQFDCIAITELPEEYYFLGGADRMRLAEQIAHCKDAWLIGFRVPVTAKRALKTLRFEGSRYTWIPHYHGHSDDADPAEPVDPAVLLVPAIP